MLSFLLVEGLSNFAHDLHGKCSVMARQSSDLMQIKELRQQGFSFRKLRENCVWERGRLPLGILDLRILNCGIRKGIRRRFRSYLLEP